MYDIANTSHSLGDKLQKACAVRGITPTALAKKAKISSSTMSYIMNGKTFPHIYTLLQICNVLEIPLSELIVWEADSCFELEMSLDQQIDKKVLQLSQQEKEWIIKSRRLTGERKAWLQMSMEMLWKCENDN